MNANTGKSLEGIEHLEQSIRDILATPVGTRVMCRSYCSRLPDRCVNVVEALTNYESRLRISRVIVNGASSEEVDITIEGFYIPDSRVIRLEARLVADVGCPPG